MVTLKQNRLLDMGPNIQTEEWMQHLSVHFSPAYVIPIQKGLNYLLSHPLLIDNQPLLQQSLSMADILIDLQTDPETVLAGLLFAGLQHQVFTADHIHTTFGKDIAQLMLGLQKMDIIHITTTNDVGEKHRNIDNFRKMMLAIIDDIRVVLIKLAEQTWLIRQAHTPSPAYQLLAQDILNMYAPLASRLGIGQLKWELEDLAFRQLHPERYKQIAKSLDSRRIDRELYVENIKQSLRVTLEKAGLQHIDLMGRAKHIYSIYNKMKRKDVDFSHIYDVIAVRVLTRTIEEAYAGLSAVHALWQPIPEEFDDYIAHPKPNGYRSIHTAVIGPEHKNIEIQLRTYQMHEESELGVAAHWKYKEGASTEVNFEKKIAWLRQVIEWQRDLSNRDKGLSHADMHSLFDDRVYLFTPAGEIIDLPYGATPLDFAYAIHSQIGHRCKGAKVNRMMVPLTYVLNTGECVEILTAKIPNPSRDWLNVHAGYIKTERARTRIQQWFKQKDTVLHIQEGRQILDRELKQHHLTHVDLPKLVKKLKCAHPDDLYAGLGRGEIRVQHLIQVAQQLLPQSEHPLLPPKTQPSKPGHEELSSTTASIQGISGILTLTAKCCKPIPGDTVKGYITRSRGIIIHRLDCPNLQKNTDSNRLIEIDWQHKNAGIYPVDIILKAHEHTDLLKDISGLLSAEKIKMLKLNTVTTTQYILIYFSIEISEHAVLDRLIEKMRRLSGVIEVQRMLG